jgi:acetolactate synthase-1/3 small subunit
VPVWAVLDYTETPTIQRELLLAKVSILGPEYVEDQLVGGPHHDPRSAPGAVDAHFEREAALASSFERGGAGAGEDGGVPGPAPLTPSEALRRKHEHLQSLSALAALFGARVVDVSANSVIVEMAAKTSRVDAFLRLLAPFGVLESARSGRVVRRGCMGGRADGWVQGSWCCRARRFGRWRTRRL